MTIVKCMKISMNLATLIYIKTYIEKKLFWFPSTSLKLKTTISLTDFNFLVA